MGKKLVCAGCKGEIKNEVCGLVFISKGQVHTRRENVPHHPPCIVDIPSPVGMTPRNAPFSPTGDRVKDALWHLDFSSSGPEEESSGTSESEIEQLEENAQRLEAIKRECEAFEQLQRDRQYCESLLSILKQCT